MFHVIDFVLPVWRSEVNAKRSTKNRLDSPTLPGDFRNAIVPILRHSHRSYMNVFQAGLRDQIVVSHDVYSKHRLLAFGGHGYRHLPGNIRTASCHCLTHPHHHSLCAFLQCRACKARASPSRTYTPSSPPTLPESSPSIEASPSRCAVVSLHCPPIFHNLVCHVCYGEAMARGGRKKKQGNAPAPSVAPQGGGDEDGDWVLVEPTQKATSSGGANSDNQAKKQKSKNKNKKASEQEPRERSLAKTTAVPQKAKQEPSSTDNTEKQKKRGRRRRAAGVFIRCCGRLRYPDLFFFFLSDYLDLF